MSLAGCEVYYNRLLDAIVYTCSPRGEVESVLDAEELASESARLVSRILSASIEAREPGSWELVAGAFNVFKHRLERDSIAVGEARVVEFCETPLVVAGVLDSGLLSVLEERVKRALLSGETLVEGEALEPVLLEKPAGVRGAQTLVPKPAVYYAEGWAGDAVARDWVFEIVEEGEVRRARLPDIAGDSEQASLEIHCVEGWSSRIALETVRLASILKPPPGSWLYAVSDRGYVAVVPGEVAERGLVAFARREEGFTPPRLVFPELYGWKWVKRVKTLGYTRRYLDGYWEARGYHERGLAMLEERFKIRNPEAVSGGALECRSREPRSLDPRAVARLGSRENTRLTRS